MANLWETDCISISPLMNAQYPALNGTWDFIVPHSNVSSDGDIHVDMAIDSSGAGSTGNNTGASPLVCEVINANSSHLNHLASLSKQQATFRGIFRFYTEHANERHFELHPVTQLQKWNGSTFVFDTDYHTNVGSDPNGTTHSTSTLTSLLDGSQTITATIAADNVSVTLNCPSPSVNYVQYDGVAVAGVQSDALSQYFLVQPNLVPGVTVRCRLVGNTAAASAAAALATNQTVTVNALTRTDMADVATQIGSMTAGQQKTFTRSVELIVLGLSNIGITPTPTPTPSVTPTPTPSVTPSPTPTPLPSATATIGTFSNTAAVTTAADGKSSPYPSTIMVTGLIGKIKKVTAQLVSIGQTDIGDSEQDLDIQIVSPNGKNIMLMSDVGANQPLSPVTLNFDDAAANVLPFTTPPTSGTYRCNNVNSGADVFPSPAPTASPSTFFVTLNDQNPNGVWSLFMVDDNPTIGSGSISGGWSVTVTTQLSAPLVSRATSSDRTSTSATITATADPLGQYSTYQFQVGLDTTFSYHQAWQPLGNGTAPISESLKLMGLKPGTRYWYRLAAQNASGTTFGQDNNFITPALVDSDGDGMPDDYETANGLNPGNAADANADGDGDGLTNLQEYNAGTDPRSVSSKLRIESLGKSGGDIAITFPSVIGKIYRVEQSATPTGPWFVLSDGILGTGDSITISDVEAADENPRRFYHVVVVP